MWIWLISNLTSRQARSLSSSSRRNRTHYWIIKVRIKARSWTEYIYNIYNWPFRTGASSYLTFAVSPVTGYLLDIYWTSSRYSPHNIFFKKISLWWPFCSIKNVTRIGFKLSTERRGRRHSVKSKYTIQNTIFFRSSQYG